ncbi:MAG TPA: phosphopantetheine-binding protein [Spongiibacteraceae bacterium]|jgi:acyl carrier protein
MLNTIVNNYLVNTKKIDPSLLENPHLRVAELGLDSLDLVEMLFEIEDRCGFQLPDPMRYTEMSYAEMLSDMESVIRQHYNGELPELMTAEAKS